MLLYTHTLSISQDHSNMFGAYVAAKTANKIPRVHAENLTHTHRGGAQPELTSEGCGTALA